MMYLALGPLGVVEEGGVSARGLLLEITRAGRIYVDQPKRKARSIDDSQPINNMY